MRYPAAYYVSVLLGMFFVGGFYLGGMGYFALPIAVFILFPPIDLLRGLSRYPSQGALRRMNARDERSYRLALAVSGIGFVLLLGWALWAVSVTPLIWWEFLGVALSAGVVAGTTGVAVAHELIHRNTPGARSASFFLISLILFSHYPIEHVYSHHVRVGTADDPITARRGQSLYAFFPRWLIGSFRQAWAIETRRIARRGHPPLSPANRIIGWYGFALALMLAIYLALGPTSLVLFVGQAAIALFIFSAVDYIEHYGLTRKRLPSGDHERIQARHSWNSSHLFNNVGLFNAGRHADHHLAPTRPYHRLLHQDEAPQLPCGYAGMIPLALVPPLWFGVMDRKLDRFQKAGNSSTA